MRLPFLYDFAAYTRFLIAIPLLILAEGLIERRVAEVLAHFIHSGLVPEAAFRAMRLRWTVAEGCATPPWRNWCCWDSPR